MRLGWPLVVVTGRGDSEPVSSEGTNLFLIKLLIKVKVSNSYELLISSRPLCATYKGCWLLLVAKDANSKN